MSGLLLPVSCFLFRSDQPGFAPTAHSRDAHTVRCSWLAAAVVTLAAARAWAADDDRPQRFHQRAVAEAKLGHYDAAAAEFLREYAITGKPELLFNAAECHRLRYGQSHDPAALREARRYYQRFIELAAGADTSRARAWLGTIDEELKRNPGDPGTPAGPPTPGEPAAAAPAPAAPPPAPAPTGRPRFRLEASGALGLMFFDGFRDLGSAGPTGTLHQPSETAAAAVGRAAFHLPLAADTLFGIVPGLELELAIVPSSARGSGAELNYLYGHLNLVVGYPLLEGRLRPFVLAGLGTVRLVSEPPPKGNGEAMVSSFDAGLGASYQPLPAWPLSARLDARYLRAKASQSVSTGSFSGADDFELLAGLSYAYGW